MEKRKGLIIVIILTLIISLGGYFIWAYYSSDNHLIAATGTIEATTVDLNARIPGVIKTITASTGEEVYGEQVVVVFTRNDLLAQKERDLWTVSKAEAMLADLENGSRQEQINEAQANYNIALLNRNQAQKDFNRIKALFAEGAVAKAEYEKAENYLSICENQLSAALARLNLLKAGSRNETIEAARIEVERSKAVLKATEAMLADTVLISPINGVVINKNYEVGEYVQMGAPVITVADLTDLWINVYIPTDDLPQIKIGQEVVFTISGMDKEFKGNVEEIASKGEFTPKSIQTKKERTNVVFRVKIRVQVDDENKGVLKPGMPADVEFVRG